MYLTSGESSSSPCVTKRKYVLRTPEYSQCSYLLSATPTMMTCNTTGYCKATMFRRSIFFVLITRTAAHAGSRFGPRPLLAKQRTTRPPHSSNDKTSPYSTSSTTIRALKLRGGEGPNSPEMVESAFGWCSNLGAPAALVAGAVLATLAETRQDLSPKKSESHTLRTTKKLTRFLLLSAFALEMVSIFSTTVTGTMLMSMGDRHDHTWDHVEYKSPLGYLRHNYEFEYLTARITFLQGLFNWLFATALEVSIPKEGEGASARRMNWFISAALINLILLMLAFYNTHMTFYHNYGHMLWVYGHEALKRFFGQWPPRPMSCLYAPAFIVTFVTGYRAFSSPPDEDYDLSEQ
jgi:hypothetical protein